MEKVKTPTRECPSFSPAVLVLGRMQATRHRRKWYGLLAQPLRDSVCGCIQQSPRNRLRLRETSELSSRPEDALNLPSHFLMRHKLAIVQGSQPLLYFSLEPFVVVDVVNHQLPHDLVRSLSRLGSDSGEPRFNFGR